MTEMTYGLRTLEMHERQTWHRERGQRELTGLPVDTERRRLFRGRVTRRTA